MTEKKDQRNEKALAEDVIDMDPEIYAAFKASTHVSCKYIFRFRVTLILILENKGTSAHMLKVGTKRRRRKEEILDAREEERLRVEKAMQQENKIMQL